MKLVILDKDGTLVKPASGKKFVQHPEDQELLPGVKSRLEQMASSGWTMVIASNQGGVASGFKTQYEVIAEMQFACDLTDRIIMQTFFCPCDVDSIGDFCIEASYRGDTWDFGTIEWTPAKIAQLELMPGIDSYELCTMGFRKPNPGMVKLAIAAQHSYRMDRIIMVGDRDEDKGASESAGIDFIWADAWRESGIK